MIDFQKLEDYLREDRSEEALKELAEGRDCEVVFADNRHLLLDLDGHVSTARFKEMSGILERNGYTFENVETWTSRGGNTHALVTLPEPMEFAERCWLQAILGSDPVREILTFMRSKVASRPDAVALFKPKHEVKVKDFFDDDLPF